LRTNMQKLFLRSSRVMVVLLLGWYGGVLAQTQLQIDIEKQSSSELPALAVPQFLGETTDPALGQQLRSVFQQDMKYTGLFRIADQATYPEVPQSVEHIQYPSWAALGVIAVISGRLASAAGDGQVGLQFALHDVAQQRMRIGNNFTGPKIRHREMAHRFSDVIYRELTGDAGPFDTQVLCVSPGRNKNSKDIVIMDYDGYGARPLVADGGLNVSPVLSPNGTLLAYTSYRSGNPNLYVRNLLTGAEERLTSGVGLAMAGSWSPDGRYLALSHTIDGNSEIFVYDTKSKQMKRITNDWGIDVSPRFAPDGKRLAFVSDRSGSPQLYVTDLPGSAPVRLTYEGRYNTAPAWSPRNDVIAFVGRADEDRSLGVYMIRPDGGGQTRLGGGGSPDAPIWAPNGRFVMYTSTQGGSRQRYMMREDGQANYLLPASGPACLTSQWVARTAR
jgi:TolB protein